MRILIVGDTHGYLDARIAELAGDADVVVHTGDIGAEAVLTLLGERCERVCAVRGNNDVDTRWQGRAPALRALPAEAVLEVPGGSLVVVHGDRWAARLRHRRMRERWPQARAVAYGHSHRLCIDDDASPWVLNPGAAGRARTYGGPSCLWLEARARRWQVRPVRFPPAPRADRVSGP